MRIAVIGAKGIPPKQGGIEHCCAELYPRIVAQTHTVDLFARSAMTGMKPFESHHYQGVRVISLPGPGIKGIDAFLTSAIGAAASSRRPYDVIHFHALGPALFTALPKLVSQAKLVVTCHGLDWQREKWGKLSSQIIQLGEQAAVRFADQLIVVSEDLQTYFKEVYGRDSVYIPNAPASYAPSDPDFRYGTGLGLTARRYLVFLGRLVPEKCPDLLLKAFQTLRPQGWKLVFVGGKSDTSAFTANLFGDALGDESVIFTGELRGGRLAEIVRGAGLFVLPSNLEGLPLSMLEAMHEGVPVLASDIVPHQQLVGSDRGILFQTGNLASCVKAMAWSIQNPEALQHMALKAQRHVADNYCWQKNAADHLKLYQTAPLPTRKLVLSQRL
jgi:glycosyltransferase involved in cell wall biosynthesis